jgi:hypothetical protein
MKKIFKYKLDSDGLSELNMPLGAKVVKCEYQRCIDNWDKINLCLWALVNPINANHTRLFATIQTGEDIPKGATYVTTVMSTNGQFVLHVFEL